MIFNPCLINIKGSDDFGLIALMQVFFGANCNFCTVNGFEFLCRSTASLAVLLRAINDRMGSFISRLDMCVLLRFVTGPSPLIFGLRGLSSEFCMVAQNAPRPTCGMFENGVWFAGMYRCYVPIDDFSRNRRFSGSLSCQLQPSPCISVFLFDVDHNRIHLRGACRTPSMAARSYCTTASRRHNSLHMHSLRNVIGELIAEYLRQSICNGVLRITDVSFWFAVAVMWLVHVAWAQSS